MIIISPTDLKNQQKKYLDLAETERVVVKRGKKLIELVVKDNVEELDVTRAISGDELLKRIIPRVEQLFDK